MIIELTGGELTLMIFALREKNFADESEGTQDAAIDLQCKLINTIDEIQKKAEEFAGK